MGRLQTRVRWFSEASRAPQTATLERPLADLTKAELSALAKERGLNPWGTKAEILGRLSDG